MKIFEVLLLLSELVLIISFVAGIGKNLRHNEKLLWVPLVLILLHALFEGIRWQLAPAYLIALIFLFASFIKYQPNKFVSISTAVLGIVLLSLTSAAAYLIPAFELPAPSGKYRVGARHMHLIDESREEIITPKPGDKRELMVKVWYPTEATSGEKEPYLSDWDRIGTARKYGMPGFFPSHFSNVNSHTFVAPEMARGQFPVLIFSHGYESPSNIYYATLTEIASHGYIVAHISHTYETSVSEFPDGRVLFNSDSFAVATNLNDKMVRVMKEWKENMQKAQNKEDSIEAIRHFMYNYSANDIVTRWSADISFVIDQLFEMNEKANHFLHGKMRLDQLGTLGHSLGGAAAAQASIFDERIKAATNWDGTQYGVAIDTVFQKPFLMLGHSPNPAFEYFNQLVFDRKGRSAFYDVRINGAGHTNWMDIPFWIRLKDITFAGDIDMERGISIINKTTLTFFDKHLRNKPVSVTSLEHEIEELEVAFYQGGQLAKKE